jgi:hypothetical protein
VWYRTGAGKAKILFYMKSLKKLLKDLKDGTLESHNLVSFTPYGKSLFKRFSLNFSFFHFQIQSGY